MFVAWVTRHMTSKHILFHQEITMSVERQHFYLSMEMASMAMR